MSEQERETFENWLRSNPFFVECDISKFDGEYAEHGVQQKWITWQAARQSRAQAQVPDDWKLVPVEPTDEMISAGADASDAFRVDVLRSYEAMLQSAPQQPADPLNGGWYCAHCQRGVDSSEVTYHEQHEACGRVITNDVLPQPADQWVRCSERLPTKEDADDCWGVWVANGDPLRVDSYLWNSVDERDFAWMPTGLRKPPAPEES